MYAGSLSSQRHPLPELRQQCSVYTFNSHLKLQLQCAETSTILQIAAETAEALFAQDHATGFSLFQKYCSESGDVQVN